MIEVEHLDKSYGDVQALKNINFAIGEGEIIGLLGPNGAGKTTIIKTLTGYLQPDQGTVLVDGLDVLDMTQEVQARIGYLPENAPLYPELSVQAYLQMMAELRQIPEKDIVVQLSEAVRATGLTEHLARPIGQLSKGFRQRVGLAQAILHKPRLLILDEPTVGLDPTQIVEIRSLIRRLAQNSTVLFSTHILPEVEATCDRILIINDGKIVADGTSESLRKQAQGQEVLRVGISEADDKNRVIASLQDLSTVGMVDPVNENNFTFIINSKDDASSKKPIFEMCVKNNWVLSELTPMETKLEDIFRELTTN